MSTPCDLSHVLPGHILVPDEGQVLKHQMNIHVIFSATSNETECLCLMCDKQTFPRMPEYHLSAQIWMLSADFATSFSLSLHMRNSVGRWEAHLEHNMQLVYPTHAALQLWLNSFRTIIFPNCWQLHVMSPLRASGLWALKRSALSCLWRDTDE